MIRTYSELAKLQTFEERFEYLKIGNGVVGQNTFGPERWINQEFYKSKEWKRIRDFVLVRDLGCDLGVNGMLIFDKPIIHHMNILTPNDIINHTEYLTNPEYLITVSHNTHNAIHYADISRAVPQIAQRSANDTCPWR